MMDDEKPEDGMSRRRLLQALGLAGAVGGVGYLAGRASADLGDAIGGTHLDFNDITSKRIAGVRIATEHDTLKHAGTDADPWTAAAWNNALSDLAALRGEVFGPSGVYSMASQISLTRNGRKLSGAPGTILKPTSAIGAASDVIVIDSDNAVSAPLEDIMLDNIELDCASITAGGNAIHVKHTVADPFLQYFNIVLARLRIRNVPSGSPSPEDGAGIYVTARNLGASGSQGVLIVNGHFYNCNVAIQTAGTSGLTISNVNIISSLSGGVWFGKRQTRDASDLGIDTVPDISNVVGWNSPYGLLYNTNWPRNTGFYFFGSGLNAVNIAFQGYGTGMFIYNTETGWSAMTNPIAALNSGIGLLLLTGGTIINEYPIGIANANITSNGGQTSPALTNAQKSGIYMSNVSARVFGGSSTINGGFGLYIDSGSYQNHILVHGLDVGVYASQANVAGKITISATQAGTWMVNIRNCPGYNPVGIVANPFTTSPAIIGILGTTTTIVASTAYKNYGTPINVIVSSGTGVAISINGTSVAYNSSGSFYHLEPGDTINFGGFSIAPTVSVISE